MLSRPMTTEPRQMAAPFHTTRWTRVSLAKSESEEGRRALSDLCGAYYEPVLAYLGRALRDREAAREMSHAFFAEVLVGGRIHLADPARGRFRFYLLGAVRHFLARQRESAARQRRGGGVAPLSLDAESPDSPRLAVADATETSPEAAFDRRWAVTVLARAMEALEAECAVEGKAALLSQLRPWLLGESGHGDQAGAAEAAGLTLGAMKVAVHRMRRRFRHRVREEIAGTLNDAAAVEDEMRSLMAALGG
jgi:DNA-directed RNA polymerase specialized sigma24 family protein